jgi:hypothetical protein
MANQGTYRHALIRRGGRLSGGRIHLVPSISCKAYAHVRIGVREHPYVVL